MKYLKKYESSVQVNDRRVVEMREEIESLCEECLSYLKDKGYMYSVVVKEDHVEICINHKDMVGGLVGDDIVDIIPLYEILLKKYNVLCCVISYADSNRELPDSIELSKYHILGDVFFSNFKNKHLAELRIGIKKF